MQNRNKFVRKSETKNFEYQIMIINKFRVFDARLFFSILVPNPVCAAQV